MRTEYATGQRPENSARAAFLDHIEVEFSQGWDQHSSTLSHATRESVMDAENRALQLVPRGDLAEALRLHNFAMTALDGKLRPVGPTTDR